MSEQLSEFRQHVRNAHNARRQQIKFLLPEAFWQHGREARKEMLLAVRSMLDEVFDHLEADKPNSAQPAEKIAKPGIVSSED